MRSVSKKRQKWIKAYQSKKEADDMVQTCPVCNRRGLKTYMDRHHTQGRNSLEAILTYIYVHRECHNKIHENGKWARENGFLE